MKFNMVHFTKPKLVFSAIIIVILVSCKTQKLYLNTVEGQRLEINNTINANPNIEAFIAPYRDRIERDLDSVLAYAVDTYSKSDGELNTAIGNLMADIVLSEGNKIFNKRTGENIDVVILNYGGIRAEIPKGPVSARTAYNVMPFENEIVVAGLKGEKINEAINYLVSRKSANPIAGLNIVVDKDYNLVSAKINNKAIDYNKTYYFATSDYLYNRGDNMTFFQPNEELHEINYKIRNAMIDYFKKTDTINPVIDNRFIVK
ncbi:5'-nucleotidase C-terminal domain-containing protein [Jejuia pallidilutea]|jgi:2',3'-cyclic-nucleotide 2'-phosphodiesterase (5'-nucleotidase family)|uniref:5'-nucleotidase n=2 Tax=Jejuia pallidilutea TaxID=504487 RepID=A0A090VLY3_9FLAO|nr:5'-nucleotidase [Jejuia pallidilutea]GAL65736.1 5'-nucleotidase [Jejuia pallidilutea]GAL72831.1 5'-nucleotidase [Jejuia pallidilutea]